MKRLLAVFAVICMFMMSTTSTTSDVVQTMITPAMTMTETAAYTRADAPATGTAPEGSRTDVVFCNTGQADTVTADQKTTVGLSKSAVTVIVASRPSSPTVANAKETKVAAQTMVMIETTSSAGYTGPPSSCV
jgi:hypothetical protein